MATAMRCTTCGISYPPSMTRCLVPDCQELLWAQFVDPPDEDWHEKVAEKGGIPAVYSAVHPSDAWATVVELKDHLFVKHNRLLQVGYKNLEAGSIVYINETFYELEGYSQSTDYWLITQIVPEGMFDELHPSMFEQWKFDADEG
jgi:hypothetical protein